MTETSTTTALTFTKLCSLKPRFRHLADNVRNASAASGIAAPTASGTATIIAYGEGGSSSG